VVVLDPTSDVALRGAPVAVIDFETTGPDPLTCRPVQVAVAWCRLGDTEPEIALKMLIDPGEPIPPGATAVHHITDEMVRGARPWPDAVSEVVQAVHGRFLAAFNLPFDWQVLARGLAEAGRDPSEVPFGALDPLVWAKTAQRYEKSKRLVDVAGRFGIEVDAHDAAGDALATALIMPKLLHQLGRHAECGAAPLRSVGGMWAWTRARGIADDLGYAQWCASKGRPAPTLVWERLAVGWLPAVG
jgi:DNA polymerase-3 subunit epsilon